MSKYKAKLATQKYVEEKIGELALVVSSPDEAVDEGVYKVIDGAGGYILITQTVGEGISPIRQSKITADGVIYSREFDIFETPFPEFTQSTVSQNDMALFKLMVDSQFADVEDELEKQRIIPSIEGESIALPDSADAQLRGLRIFGKTTQADTPSIENPQPLNSVGDDGSVDVNVHGKNMVDINNPYSVTSGASFVCADNIGVITRAEGVYTPSLYYDIGTYKDFVGKTLSVSTTMSQNTGDSSKNCILYISGSKGNDAGAFTVVNTELYNGKKTILKYTIPENTSAERLMVRLYFQNLTTAEASATITELQVELGNTSTPYESYKPIQTLTIPTPNGLPGVPVSSDGNYTDASGQQWVCDEKDYNREVYIQRVGEWRYTGGDLPYMASCMTRPSGDILYFNIRVVGVSGKYSEYKNALCNSFISGKVLSVQNAICITPGTNDYLYFSIKASDVGVAYGDGKTTDELKAIVREWMQNTFSEDNPLIAKYPLLEPTETPLSEAEINAYKELYTHYPNTSIHNSENAHMAVDYVADTKNYVDNQIKKEVAELTAAILTQ